MNNKNKMVVQVRMPAAGRKLGGGAEKSVFKLKIHIFRLDIYIFRLKIYIFSLEI